MHYDIVFANGSLVSPDDIRQVNVCVANGKVAALTQDIPESDRIVDCSGMLVMPGCVDMHFHCRTPGNSAREDFDSATMGAARGGVTTIAEMPIAKPSPHNAETLRARIIHASSLAVVDFAFYGAGATRSPETAMQLAQEGVIGFKLFLHSAPKGREDEFCSLCAPTSEELFESFAANAPTGLITCVHAEDDGLIRALDKRYPADQRKDYHAQMAIRAPECESLAVCNVAMASRLAQARAHICHVSSLEAEELVSFLQKHGSTMLTAETCPHYLLMSADDMERYGTLAKVNPPLRDRRHQQALWRGLHDGTLSAIASDHAPFLKPEKATDDFPNAPGGMPSIEFFGPMLWDAVHAGLLTWQQVVCWASAAPARLLGLYPQKGNLSIGADADLILVDPDGTWGIDTRKLFTRSRESAEPLTQRSYRSRLTATWVRGQEVYSNNGIHVKQGYGKFLPGKLYANV